MAVSCYHDHEHSCSIKVVNLLGQLGNIFVLISEGHESISDLHPVSANCVSVSPKTLIMFP